MKKGIIFLLGLCLFAHRSAAQTCTGTWGVPIVNQTFGQGNDNAQFYGPLSTYAPGVTTTTTFIYSTPNDNFSCLTDNANYAQPSSWCGVTDHTGNPNGLMFVINAPSSGGTVFVEYTMQDLCPNTALQLSIWVLNVDGGVYTNQQYPNMTMQVVDPFTNTILDSVQTGNVSFDCTWHQYTMVFNNGNSSTVTLKVINNSVGNGFGNDLALDDVTVSPCVPITHIVPKLDTTIACQSVFIPFTATISGNAYNPPEYQWQYSTNMGATWVNAAPPSGANTYYFTASAFGTYWIRFLTGPLGFAGNSNCSAVSDTSIVTISSTPLPPPTVVSPVVYCQYATADSLTAVGVVLNWYGTDSSAAPSLSTPLIPNTATVGTTYYFVTQGSGICASTPDSIKVIVNPLPVITASSNAPLCSGATLLLAASAEGQGVSYSWSGPGNYNASGSGQAIPGIAATGIYTVTGVLNGCSDTASVIATVYPLPTSTIATNINGTLCAGDSLLVAINNYDPSFSYHWSPASFFLYQGNDSTAWATVTFSGNIYLTATNTLGCVATDSVFINTQPCCIMRFPSAFTPNGDGKDDVFRAITIGHYPSFYLMIVNRWGQTVFETYDENGAWNGAFNGMPQDMGVYNYFARYQCSGKQVEEKGDVTLIR